MLYSLAIILITAIIFSEVLNKLNLPKIIGYIFSGILLGPYVLNQISQDLLNISAEIRKIALIIILIRAGLSLNLEVLKKVGRPAALMSFLPASFEIFAYAILGPMFFNIDLVNGILLGAVMAAVSPAVVVPRMVSLNEEGYGNDKGIPQLVLAGASLDDVYTIVIFTSFLGLAQGGSLNFLNLLNIPISIIFGLIFGGICGLFLHKVLEVYERKNKLNKIIKLLLILASSFILSEIERFLSGKIAFSGLLAIMSMALVFQRKSSPEEVADLSGKFGKLWIIGELFLFVLVGGEVNINYLENAGFEVLGIIFLSLIIRSLGVIISLTGTNLNLKEKLFVLISYLPKATVQAAIGSVPLSLGLASGELILTIAVLGIILTAPLGAIGMDLSYKKLLNKI